MRISLVVLLLLFCLPARPQQQKEVQMQFSKSQLEEKRKEIQDAKTLFDGDSDDVSWHREFDGGHSILDRSGETCGNRVKIAGIAYEDHGDKWDRFVGESGGQRINRRMGS